MHILHINSGKDVDKIDKFIKNGSDVFILVYMEGCGPCKATRPEWEKIESALKHQYVKNNKLVIVDVNKDYLSNIKNIGSIDGFPTIKYISSKGSVIEPYEKSSIKKKDRSVNSFINWIETKINNVISTTPTGSAHHVYKRLSQKKHYKKARTNKKSLKGSKWTRKYKTSITPTRKKNETNLL